MPDILVHSAVWDRIGPQIISAAPDHRVVRMTDEGEFVAPDGVDMGEACDPEVVFGNTDAFFSPSVASFMGCILKASDLRWFQSSAAGLEHPVLQAIGAKAGAYTSSHVQSEAIAEWVLWAGLDAFQRGPERRQQQEEKVWTRLPWREIAGSHWLIVGFGSIGQACGKRLRALGAQVTGVRRTPGSDDAADSLVTPDQLREVLPDADAVVLCLPLTSDTENIADAGFFASMKPGAFYANVGRGGLNDEDALLAALDSGQVSRAALDVFQEEPLPEASPIWHYPSVTVTPHISALTDGSLARADALFLENLKFFLAGEPLRNRIPARTFSAGQIGGA